MSDYKSLVAVGETIKQLLWSVMRFDPAITGIIPTEDRIVFEPPFKLVKDADPDESKLSVFLYRITENSEMRNRPTVIKDDRAVRYPPMALNLYYLVTPLANSAENDQHLLGKVLHTLYDHGTLKGDELQGALAGSGQELRVFLSPVSLEDMTKLWGAFARPYRLSVCYEVKVAQIDSDREAEAPRVRRRKLDVGRLTTA